MKSEKKKISDTIEIVPRYFETDQMGVIHHSVYFVWFEVGRLELMRRRGLDYSELEREGYKMPVIECSARFHSPAYFGDKLSLEVEIVELTSKILGFSYKLFNPEKNKKLAIGKSRHVLLGEGGKVKNFPEEWKKKLYLED